MSRKKLRYLIKWSNLTGLDWNEILVARTKGEENGVDKSQVEGKCRKMSLSQPEIKGIQKPIRGFQPLMGYHRKRRLASCYFSLTADFWLGDLSVLSRLSLEDLRQFSVYSKCQVNEIKGSESYLQGKFSFIN